MMRTIGTVCLVALLLSACGEGSKSAGPAIPADPAKAEALIAKGGTAWNSPATVKSWDKEVKGGDRFWIMPASDGVTVVKGNRMKLTFHWRLRPGKEKPGPHGKDDIIGQFEFEKGGVKVVPNADGAMVSGGGLRADLAIGAEHGTFVYDYDMKDSKISGEGWVSFYLVAQGWEVPPSSNLLRLKLRFE